VTFSKATVDLLLWILFGAVLGCWIARKYIKRHMAGLLDKALQRQPGTDEWKQLKAYLSSDQLGLPIGACVLGAAIGAGIGGAWVLVLMQSSTPGA
jgi:hypothetical protein